MTAEDKHGETVNRIKEFAKTEGSDVVIICPVWKPPSTTRRVEITVGTYGQYPNIAEALKNIPKKAGEVMIFLTSDTEEPPDGFGIPIDRGIAYVQIHSSDGGVKNVRDR